MRRSATQGLDFDSEICLVSSAGLVGAGMLAGSLNSLTLAAVLFTLGIGVGMSTTATKAFLKRKKR